MKGSFLNCPAGEICVNDEAGSVGMSWWVGEPDAQGIARLVGEADRYVTDNWLAAVHAGDCEVVPRATYGVRAVLVGGDQPEPESGQLEVTTIAKPINGYWADAVGDLDYYCTGDWSDCPNGDPDCPLGESCIEQWSPPNGIINFNDVAATVFAFQQAPGLTLPEVMWVDVHGSDSGVPIFDPPDHVANFADIGFIVAAFEGRPYPFSDPADCPN